MGHAIFQKIFCKRDRGEEIVCCDIPSTSTPWCHKLFDNAISLPNFSLLPRLPSQVNLTIQQVTGLRITAPPNFNSIFCWLRWNVLSKTTSASKHQDLDQECRTLEVALGIDSASLSSACLSCRVARLSNLNNLRMLVNLFLDMVAVKIGLTSFSDHNKDTAS